MIINQLAGASQKKVEIKINKNESKYSKGL